MALNPFTPEGCFSSTFPRFGIGNSYTRPSPLGPNSVAPKSSLPDLEYAYLVAGDFNIHNSVTNACRLPPRKMEGTQPRTLIRPLT